MKPIPPGTTGSFTLVVKPEHLASQFKDSTLPPILATPVMIMIMENAALNAIKPYLDAGESALGTRVDITTSRGNPAGAVGDRRGRRHEAGGAAHRVRGPRAGRRRGDRQRNP